MSHSTDEQKHTPGPWAHRPPNEIDRRHRIYQGENLIAVLDPGFGADEVEANARFIVRAVNSHEALVKALGGLLDAGIINPTGSSKLNAAIKAARAACQQVGGE